MVNGIAILSYMFGSAIISFDVMTFGKITKIGYYENKKKNGHYIYLDIKYINICIF